jgi:hypothetical protein
MESVEKIQRYGFEGVSFGSQCYESDEGGWVKYEDHAAALAAERRDADATDTAIRHILASFDESDSDGQMSTCEIASRAAQEVLDLRDALRAERANTAQWKERAQRAEAEAMTLRDFERARNTINRQTKAEAEL